MPSFLENKPIDQPSNQTQIQIERDEADIVVPGMYTCNQQRGTLANCAPGYGYYSQYWFSKEKFQNKYYNYFLFQDLNSQEF